MIRKREWLAPPHLPLRKSFQVPDYKFNIVGNMPSNTLMKAKADGADGLPFYDNFSFIRSLVFIGCVSGLHPVKFRLTVAWEPLAGFLTLGVLALPQEITILVEDYLVKRVLGWRGGKGVTTWALPFVELLQLSTTWNLYHWACMIAHQRADIFDLTKFRIGSTVILASSIISSMWMTGVFCYFNFIRMSRTPHRYEPVHQPPRTTETEPTLLFPSPRSPGASKSRISALAEAFECQRHQGLDTRRRLSVHGMDGHFNVSSIRPSQLNFVLHFANANIHLNLC
jgi:hypothetical protein